MYVGPVAGLRSDSHAGTVPDHQLVYCLDPQRALALGQAAVALGLAEATVPPDRIVVARPKGQASPAAAGMTIAEWRRVRPDGFRRTCTALVKAAPAGQGPTTASAESNPIPRWLDVAYSSLLPLLAGVAVSKLSLNRQRRGDLANQLRTAQPEFAGAVTVCLNRPRDAGAAATMTQHRRTLGALLDRAAALRPGRPLAPVLARLRANQGPLGETFFQTPVGGAAAEEDHRRTVSFALQEVQQSVELLAQELDTPRWRSWGRS
jgi:hypothetical protein